MEYSQQSQLDWTILMQHLRSSREKIFWGRGGRGAEWGGVWEGCPLPSRLWVWGRVPAGNAFWRILQDTECSFLHLYALSSSNSVSCHIWGSKAKVWGQLPPPHCPNVELPLATFARVPRCLLKTAVRDECIRSVYDHVIPLELAGRALAACWLII